MPSAAVTLSTKTRVEAWTVDVRACKVFAVSNVAMRAVSRFVDILVVNILLVITLWA